MTEVTRVPLRPIKQGSLAKLWLSVVVLILVAVLAAWVFVPRLTALTGGTTIQTVQEGSGASPGADDYVLINYTGTLDDGTVFDKADNAPLQVSGVVPGFSNALQEMQAGGRYRVRIPADEGYGAQGGGPIPPNADLNFDVELIEFRSRAEVEAMQQQMMQQQMMQQQLQQQQGAPPAQ